MERDQRPTVKHQAKLRESSRWKSVVILMRLPLCMTLSFSLAAYNICCLFYLFRVLTIIWGGELVFYLYNFDYYSWIIISFPTFVNSSSMILLKMLSVPLVCDSSPLLLLLCPQFKGLVFSWYLKVLVCSIDIF